jgi:hypothetical protein
MQESTPNETAAGRSPLRLLTAALIGVESLVALSYLIVFNTTGDSNALANIAVNSVTAIVLGLWLIFVLPALVLVIRNTRLELALGLALVAIPAVALSFMIV